MAKLRLDPLSSPPSDAIQATSSPTTSTSAGKRSSRPACPHRHSILVVSSAHTLHIPLYPPFGGPALHLPPRETRPPPHHPSLGALGASIPILAVAAHPGPPPATAATMDDFVKDLASFPPSRDPPKTDKQYHDVLLAHVKNLDGLLRKHQSLISSNPEKILSVRLLHYAACPVFSVRLTPAEPPSRRPHGFLCRRCRDRASDGTEAARPAPRPFEPDPRVPGAFRPTANPFCRRLVQVHYGVHPIEQGLFGKG